MNRALRVIRHERKVTPALPVNFLFDKDVQDNVVGHGSACRSA